MTHYTSLALTYFNLACFAWSLSGVFRPGKPDRRFALLKIVWNIAAFACLWAEWKNPLDSPQRWMATDIMLVTSLLLFWYSAHTIRNVDFTVIFSPDTPNFIMKRGPYKYIRHPFYTAYILTFSGAALATLHPLVCALDVIIIGLYTHAALSEEKKFYHSSLGTEYEVYSRRAGLFWPKVKW